MIPPLLAACTGGVGDDLGAYFVISGPVDPGVPVGGERTTAAIAWVWLLDGELAGVVAEVPFEPRVYSYAVEVTLPPDPETATVSAPSGLGASGLALLFGLPVLVEPGGPGAADLRVDPEALLAWVAGTAGTLDGAVSAERGTIAAVTAEHLLILTRADSGWSRLATAPEWTIGTELCRVDGALPGLTLYRTLGTGCSGWDPLAPSGTRTEFQGVPMLPVP